MSIGRLEHHLFREYMRAAVVDAVGRCGHTRLSVAEEAGISLRALSVFLKGGELPHEAARKLNSWSEVWGFGGAWAEQAALSLLVEGLPVAARLDARAEFTRWYEARFVAVGQDAPQWVADELEEIRLLKRQPRPRPEGEAA